jgi:hypothetical protein
VVSLITKWLGYWLITLTGVDTSLIVTPLRNFGTENHRTLSSLPTSIPLAASAKSGLLISWCDRELLLWKFANAANGSSTQNETSQPPLIGKILLNVRSAVQSIPTRIMYTDVHRTKKISHMRHFPPMVSS